MAHEPDKVLIWGAGGHGRVIADIVRSVGWSLVGFIDRNREKLGARVEPGGAMVVALEPSGAVSWGQTGLPCGANRVVLGIGDNRRRLDCMTELKGIVSRPLVHPSAVVSPSAEICEGTVVFAGAVINCDARVGRAGIVNSGAIVEHDCRIGDGVHLAPGAVLAGGVTVGDRTLIGIGAAVIQGITIGSDVVIGAAAAVIRDVPPRTRVVGVPGLAK